MDKQSYKEMLAETMSDLSTAEKEINRLQILVAKYSDQYKHIMRLTENHPNDMDLGGEIRQIYWQKEKEKHSDKNNL